ncbi:MAG: CocE/NonD family hydrolase [Cardiobacteriaceae bacterium]|nr:CocE/NonD family hydrolase [Cardiobacteriaceae bacterium]
MMTKRFLQNCMVRMRDGVHLATDIYLPDKRFGSSFPVVLERTPYDKSAHSRSEINRDGHKISREEMAEAFNERGMAVVFQDCRGRYRSEGVFIKYVNEAYDGEDTLHWLLEQSWCNGKIGTMGLSYAAHTQMALACLSPKALCAMVLDSGGFANAYQCGIRQGGAFELKQVTWAFKQAKNSREAKQNPVIREALERQNIHDWFKKMPWTAGHSPLSVVPEYEEYLLEQWQHGTFDADWQRVGLYAEGYYAQIPDIPVLHMSSWYDAYVSSTLSNFKGLQGNGKTAPQSLIMGSWLHGDRNIAFSGDVDFGEQACFDGQVAKDWLSYRLDFFGTYLLGQSALSIPPVQIFVMGGGRGRKNEAGRLEHGGYWLCDEHFPPQGVHEEAWYFGAEGRLSTALPELGECRFQADPHHPVPTIGGAITSGKPVYVGGAFDQRERPDFFATDGSNQPLSARRDVLSFQSALLEEDILVAGEIEAEVWLQSNAPDCDVVVKLLDIYPPSEDYPEGFAMNITDGIMRARYRTGWDKPSLMQGEVVKLVIKPFATANLFKKGHRIRVDIAGSNFPHFDVNPNSGEAEGFGRCPRIAENRIFLGGVQASHIKLPVRYGG